MSDPWEVQEKQAKVYFAQSQIVRTEKHGQSGNTYFEMDIWLTPIETDKQVITRKFRSFNPEWEKITVPSVMKLVQDKRIAKPIEMEQATKLVAYRWTEYRDYTKKSVDYWLAKDPSKILTDELKRNYKTVMSFLLRMNGDRRMRQLARLSKCQKFLKHLSMFLLLLLTLTRLKSP
jgi:hypothetical protein